MRRFLVVVCTLVFLSRCISDEPMRGTHDFENEYAPGSLPPECRAETSIERARGYTLGIIEINDRGRLRSDLQRAQVFAELDRVARDRGVNVLIFVHGWHHNADPNDPNLSNFRTVLAELSAADRTGRPFMGIYLSWRGEPFTARSLEWLARHPAVAWIKHTSFWKRKNTSFHVGANGANDVLREIDEHVMTLKHRHLPVTMVTVGHSFGGAIVLTAVAAKLVNFSYCRHHGFCWPTLYASPQSVTTFGDLVILLNPGVEAERFVPFDLYSKREEELGIAQPVSMLVIASNDDVAVRRAFPAGRLIPILAKPLRRWAMNAELHALGAYRPQVNARILPTTQPEANDCPTGTAKWKLCRNPGTSAAPFVVAQSAKGLIASHDDIFNDDIREFLVAYIRDSYAQQAERARRAAGRAPAD